MKKSIFYVLFAAVSALTMPAADDKASHGTGKDFEQHFLTKTPHHHQQAIEMAQLCESKAANADLKAFCTKLMASQQKEKQQMNTWRQSWYEGQGAVPQAEMQEMEAKHKKHMAELQSATGGKFDHAFLTSMTEHHRDGLPEMKACQGRAVHAELKQLCTKMSKDQQDDIQRMQQLMKSMHSAGSDHKH
jgi:uncharacterized protein (DUF305 family)